MITYSSVSKKGSRSANEDYVAGVKKGDGYLFILCDGLGGCKSGEVVSQLAAESFRKEFRYYNGDAMSFFKTAFEKTKQVISEKQKDNYESSEMKSTLVALIIDGEKFSWAHVGDSRLYFFNNGKLESRTFDHSVPEMLFRAGEINESEIRFHPDRNKLLRALGDADNETKYSVSDFSTSENDSAFLLCSDGYWEYIVENEMEYLLTESEDAKDWLRKMTYIVEQKNSASNADNYSAIAVVIKKEKL